MSVSLPGYGREICVSDGTATGTYVLKDIVSGPYGSNPAALTVVGDRVFFFAFDTLWVTDGTPDGTVSVASLGQWNSGGPFIALGDHAVFLAYIAGSGSELWRTDGTPGGTYKLIDLDATASTIVDWSHDKPIAWNGYVYFAAVDALSGKELWRTDGVSVTTRVRDIAAGPADSSPSGLAILGEALYFRATTAASGTDLWKTDGTEVGTVAVDVAPGLDSWPPTILTAHDGLLYIYACDIDDGCGLWTSNGTAAGTSLIAPLMAGADATAVGTLNGRILFVAMTPGHYRPSLFASDGTPEGTLVLTDSSVLVEKAGIAFADRFYFPADGAPFGRELWATELTAATTALFKDLQTASSGDSRPKDFRPALGRVFFRADSQPAREDIWVTEGTPETTQSFTEMFPVLAGRAPEFINATSTRALFWARDEGVGHELWSTDLTVGGTAMIADINPDPYSSKVPQTATAVLNDVVLFFANEAATGEWALWRSDGTPGGTWRVKGFASPYVQRCGPRSMVKLGAFVYFGAATTAGGAGAELWRTDGTEPGTTLVKDINPGPASSSPCGFVESNGQLFFPATHAASGTELWRTNGTAAGTVLVKDIAAGTQSSTPVHLTAASGNLIFAAAKDADGQDLYLSDGTQPGTIEVQALGVGVNQVGDIEVVGPYVYIAVASGSSRGVSRRNHLGQEYWPIVLDQSVTSLAAVGPRVFFTSCPNADCELWSTLGSMASTEVAADIRPGPDGSLPQELTAIGNSLYFSANDGLHGIEPFAAQLPPQPKDTAGDFTGDAIADLALRRAASASWLVPGAPPVPFGLPNDILVSGDFDGLPGGEVGVFRPLDGTWTIDGFVPIQWGMAGDVPVVADYNGDGFSDIAVFRPWTAQWFVRGAATRVFGSPGDVALPGDYNGDGTAERAIYRPSTGAWFVDGLAPVAWGQPGDIPVPADYDGNGTVDIAVYRPANATWYVRNQFARVWGATADVPVPLDLTGEGRVELVLWRPKTATWHVLDLNTDTTSVVPHGAVGDMPALVPAQLARGRAFDTDGDRQADPSVVRSATWYFLRSSTNFSSYVAAWFNVGAGSVPVPGDYDGDGRLDLSARLGGGWIARYSTADFAYGPSEVAPGGAAAIPVDADYDGDGRTDTAGFVASTGLWTVRLAANNFTSGFTRTWGTTGDIPVVADYDGDGRADPAVFRPSVGVWYVQGSGGAGIIRAWGIATDKPIARDFDGDFRADMMIYRNGAWWLLRSSTNWTGGSALPLWGLSTDIPVAADYDGDGKTDQAVFRPSTGVWYVRNQFTVQWGTSGDVPLLR